MARINHRRSRKAGMPPGSLIHIGDKKAERTTITIIDYDGETFQEKKAKSIEECCVFKETSTVTWINIDGVHDSRLISDLGSRFGIHPLILEDIMTTAQRPKIEDMGDYLYIVIRMLDLVGKQKEVRSEQVSLILGSNFVISFQEDEGDVFDAVRDRIRTGKGRIRKLGPDYLAYSLLDAVIDNYFIVIEKLGESIGDIEEELVQNPDRETIHKLHAMKREMIFLRKSVWPLREVISGLERTESELIKETTGIFLRDLYDHTIQVIDSVETYRDMLSGMLDIYLSSVSNRMNEVMKVLTIIATIFIPLTFIAGIYGMNFKFMPELEWRWGYFLVLAVMLAIGVLMLILFKRKRWL
ncbi:MAG: magnesium/cobalt transporter CorA [Candidatus Aminicenantales bacterium]